MFFVNGNYKCMYKLYVNRWKTCQLWMEWVRTGVIQSQPLRPLVCFPQGSGIAISVGPESGAVFDRVMG